MNILDKLDTDVDCHFTYCRPPNRNILQQGDILLKNEQIVNMLREIHPHYLKDDYTHFIVLTQTCDLMRRGKNLCRAKYITLAAVRPLDLFLSREIHSYQPTDLEIKANVCSKGFKYKVKQLLERLLNNNESEYFYLHEEPEMNFSNNSVAFLRLSIAIRTTEHYDTCLEARILSLSDIFKAKLGWLVGNMYSRVGTEEWIPRYTNNEFKKLIDGLLNATCFWVDQKRLNKVKDIIPDSVLNSGEEHIRKFIDSAVVNSHTEDVLDCVLNIIKESDIITDDNSLINLKYRLINDSTFVAITKQVEQTNL